MCVNGVPTLKFDGRDGRPFIFTLLVVKIIIQYSKDYCFVSATKVEGGVLPQIPFLLFFLLGV